jgi:hypothetical protein
MKVLTFLPRSDLQRRGIGYTFTSVNAPPRRQPAAFGEGMKVQLLLRL